MNIPAAESNGSNLGPSPAAMDSITLGQLKAMVSTQPKPKQWWYDFNYDDEDTVMNEIDELYSYIEMPQVAENLKAWQQGSFGEDWTKASPAKRRLHVELLLEGLEHRDAIVRFTNSRRLFYIVQGTFAETVSPEHQLHWIFENCKTVRAANGVSSVIEALKIASAKQDFISQVLFKRSREALLTCFYRSLTENDIVHLNISQQDKADLQEEVLTEISVYFGILYHLIEIFKGHDDFADELMSLDPPLPVYLFNLVSGLRDKSAKGYPIKKLLLLLWKSLLACFGGIRDHARVKVLARELAGLPTTPGSQRETTIPIIKSSPLDIEAFRQETSVKYPTFVPPPPPPPDPNAPIIIKPLPSSLTSKLAQAYSPIPVRHHYHHDDLDNQSGLPSNSGPHPFAQNPGAGGPFRPTVQPPTPAPSPPPPPPNAKPKKQQYQTDQSRPFLFPFSKAQGKDARLVPFAIDEADKLYNRHMYVSLALSQMWRTREDCMTFESGLEHMPGSEGEFEPSTFTSKDPETAEPLPDVAILDAKLAEATAALEKAQTPAEKRKLRERREDLMRLKRVEQIYSAVLPVLSGWVLVLLKLLLATVSAATNAVPQSAASPFPPGVASPQEQPNLPPPTLDEIDVTRHREITSKAVSAILLLVLKWFKVSHVMKFHHLGQLLLDTNCLLLLLKLFGLQEVSTSLVSKADALEHNFFRYCLLNYSKNPQHMRPEDNLHKAPRHTITKKVKLPNGEEHEEEVEMVTDFSWRNFFATINFAKIMQKLSKNRSHRIWMLVQYKSSAVLKRMLRVQHPMLQLHLLKLIKSQVPFCGRKWRQSNMKVITAIYLNCRPDLRDEWLTGTEVDDVTDASAQETALRHLVKFYNNQRYGASATANQHGALHKRSGSMSNHLEGLHPGPELSGIIRPIGTPNMVEADVFPPARSQAPDPSIFLPYIPEDISFEEEYEEYISDLGLSDSEYASASDPALFGGGGTSAWSRFPVQFAQDIADGISDSESIVSIGDLGDEARLDPNRDDGEVVDENLNNWEHMSPKTMAALPKSPHGRRSSSGGGLRPVVPFGLDDGSAVDEEDEEEEIGPAPREQSAFADGAGVDEVEYAYGV
ncbi:cell cycle arrest in response to pheromone-related protein [Moniliophthora roreri]|nr:cell cycle arrest in response to pheromone-related protein [Moniliophthora roreri]